MLLFTSKKGGKDIDYDPTAPLDENGKRGVNIGVRGLSSRSHDNLTLRLK